VATFATVPPSLDPLTTLEFLRKPRVFYKWLPNISSFWQLEEKGIPPDGTRASDAELNAESIRYNLAGKCVSVGDDGTIVGMNRLGAYRFDNSTKTWTLLPDQWRDISVVKQGKMWGVSAGGDVFSTIV
jgi:hypothetical protein